MMSDVLWPSLLTAFTGAVPAGCAARSLDVHRRVLRRFNNLKHGRACTNTVRTWPLCRRCIRG